MGPKQTSHEKPGVALNKLDDVKENDSRSRVETRAFKIPFGDGKEIICERFMLQDGPSHKDLSLIFTHGAGGGIENPALRDFAAGFSQVGSVVLFQGNMNLQSRVKTFHAVIQHESGSSQTKESTSRASGGSSMGARAAVIAATESQGSDRSVQSLVLVSYPLIGGSKGDLRDQILPEEACVLFISGSEDSMCPPTRLNEVREKMKAKSWLCEVKGADHGMSLKKASKECISTLRKRTGLLAARWVFERDENRSL